MNVFQIKGRATVSAVLIGTPIIVVAFWGWAYYLVSILDKDPVKRPWDLIVLVLIGVFSIPFFALYTAIVGLVGGILLERSLAKNIAVPEIAGQGVGVLTFGLAVGAPLGLVFGILICWGFVPEWMSSPLPIFVSSIAIVLITAADVWLVATIAMRGLAK